MAGIDKLIINSAYREPDSHWKYDFNGQKFIKEPGRRPAGYFIAGQGSNQYNDIGQFIELPLVNKIRPRVKSWREAGYPGVTGVTKKLLEHWNDNTVRQYPFFFCQLDAIETIIWLTEAPDSQKVGIDIPNDGGEFRRLCTKLCTGGGKTTVMAMLIAWMICNKVFSIKSSCFVIVLCIIFKNPCKCSILEFSFYLKRELFRFSPQFIKNIKYICYYHSVFIFRNLNL